MLGAQLLYMISKCSVRDWRCYHVILRNLLVFFHSYDVMPTNTNDASLVHKLARDYIFSICVVMANVEYWLGKHWRLRGIHVAVDFFGLGCL